MEKNCYKPTTQSTVLIAQSSMSSGNDKMLSNQALFLLENRNYSKLYNFCRDQELELGGDHEGKKEATSLWLSLQMCACLLKHDLDDARYLWRRSPEFLKGTAEYKNLWAIGKAMTQIQPEIVYKICDESQWSLLIQPFIRATKQETQRHYRDFLIEAYSIISVTECGRFLGLSEQETVQFVPSLGWTVEGPLITPAHPTKRKHQQASLTQLDQLTTYIADLEQQQ